MVTYIVRRLMTAALILLGASFLVYLLTAASGDPLEEFRANNSPQKQALMDARTQLLQLDVPAPSATSSGSAARPSASFRSPTPVTSARTSPASPSPTRWATRSSRP